MVSRVWNLSKPIAWLIVLLHPIAHAFEGGAAESLVTAALARLECEK